MAKADTSKVGKPERKYQDQLWMGLAAAAERLESRQPDSLFWGYLALIEEQCKNAGWIDSRGKPMCFGNGKEWRIYSQTHNSWADIKGDKAKHTKRTIDESRETLIELKERRADELKSVAARAMALLATRRRE